MIFALVAVLAGAALSTLSNLLAAATTGTPADFAPWISGGGAVTAVGGIVYIARLMATGQLVARDPAKEAAELKTLLDQVLEVTRTGADREAAYRQLLLDGYGGQHDRPHR